MVVKGIGVVGEDDPILLQSENMAKTNSKQKNAPEAVYPLRPNPFPPPLLPLTATTIRSQDQSLCFGQVSSQLQISGGKFCLVCLSFANYMLELTEMMFQKEAKKRVVFDVGFFNLWIVCLPHVIHPGKKMGALGGKGSRTRSGQCDALKCYTPKSKIHFHHSATKTPASIHSRIHCIATH